MTTTSWPTASWCTTRTGTAEEEEVAAAETVAGMGRRRRRPAAGGSPASSAGRRGGLPGRPRHVGAVGAGRFFRERPGGPCRNRRLGGPPGGWRRSGLGGGRTGRGAPERRGGQAVGRRQDKPRRHAHRRGPGTAGHGELHPGRRGFELPLQPHGRCGLPHLPERPPGGRAARPENRLNRQQGKRIDTAVLFSCQVWDCQTIQAV